MPKSLIKSILPHLVAVVVFIVVSFAYFSPLLEGKRIQQSDIVQFTGMSKEIVDYRNETGEEALWTNRMFGGMPAYLISVVYHKNLFRSVDQLLCLQFPVPARFLFLSLIGFYILLLAFGTDPWLSMTGALAFGFSTYFFIIGGVGHNSKAHAMAYMAPVIAGIFLTFRGKIWWGAAITGFFLALQILAGHPQITYYTAMAVLILGIVYFIDALKQKKHLSFLSSTLVLLVAAMLAVGSNITGLLLTIEYGKYSTRGKSELTKEQAIKTSGLDKDYILNDYSYGIKESMNLLIPNFLGGKSVGPLNEKSETYQVVSRQNPQYARQFINALPLYWGNQRYTAGPVYIGAVVIFLFVLGLFLVKGPVRWWVIAVTLLSLALAWGQNLRFLSELFIDYFPGYNKFRTVSMILVIAQLTIPVLGILAVKEILEMKIPRKEIWKALKWSAGIVGGICLFFAIFPGWLLSFRGPVDEQLVAGGWPDFLLDALRDDRKSLLQRDAFRSFVFVVLASGLIVAFVSEKLSKTLLYISVAGLILFDLWPVNRRYLDNDHFVSAREAREPFRPSQADLRILQDDELYFRVFNLTVSPFNDASTSYYHHSIGGYHGAKMERYQELIEYHISRNNEAVLNMLNTKYLIVPGENNQPVAMPNPGALGNAWFVDSLVIVENADEEILTLNDFDPATTAIVDRRFEHLIGGFVPGYDSTANISLEEYRPNALTYSYNAISPQMVVFSDIYYDRGWKAYIDGVEAPHFRANYVLRAMIVPAGSHEIEFVFRPRTYFIGENISLASSLLLLVLFFGMVVIELRGYLAGEQQVKN